MIPVRLGFVYETWSLRIQADGCHFSKEFVGVRRIPDYIYPVELHAEQQEPQERAAHYARW